MKGDENMLEKNGKAGLSLESELVAMFIQTASKFSSQINLKKGDKVANAKSIMGLISLGVVDGENITLSADGIDAESALTELSKFLNIG